MSDRQKAAIWYATNIPGSCLATALALADWSDDAGICYPKLITIGAKTNVSERTAQRHVATLVDLGYVEIVEPARRHRTPTYRLHPEVIIHENELPDTTATPPAPIEDRREEPRHDKVSPLNEPRGDNLTPLNEPRHDKVSPLKGDTPKNQEPVKEQETLAEAGQLERIVDSSPPEPERPRNPIWDAISDLLGPPSQAQTKLQGALVAELTDKGVDASEIPRIGARLALAWGPTKLTLGSLRKHWTRFADTNPLAGATDDDRTRYVEQQARQARRARMRELEGGTG